MFVIQSVWRGVLLLTVCMEGCVDLFSAAAMLTIRARASERVTIRDADLLILADIAPRSCTALAHVAYNAAFVHVFYVAHLKQQEIEIVFL